MSSPLHPDFSTVDVSAFPPLSAMPDDSTRCLWILWIAKESLASPWLVPAQVSDELRDVYGVSVPRQRAEALLSRAKAGNIVARRVIGGRRFYQVMDTGIAAVKSVETSVMFITPEQSLTSIRAVEDLLGTLRGHVRICDPYIDGRTLDWLAGCTHATTLHLLTTNIKNRTTTFARDNVAFN
jgi:hypothetical protein